MEGLCVIAGGSWNLPGSPANFGAKDHGKIPRHSPLCVFVRYVCGGAAVWRLGSISWSDRSGVGAIYCNKL